MQCSFLEIYNEARAALGAVPDTTVRVEIRFHVFVPYYCSCLTIKYTSRQPMEVDGMALFRNDQTGGAIHFHDDFGERIVD